MIRRTALPLIALASGCGGLAPVARPPWVEDRSLELRSELLLVEVDRATASVEAHLDFRGSMQARELGFPIGGETGAILFEALVIEQGEPPVALEARKGGESQLPVGGAVSENWDIVVPENVLGREGTELVVRYRQPARDSFRYVLKSGAYWAGSIRSLLARVNDPGGRVTRAELDAAGPHEATRERFSWSLRDYEPQDGLTLELD